MSLTKVVSSAAPLLASGRIRRFARKWPWSWYCTSCDHAYGAAKTRAGALMAAQQHETTAHPKEN